MSPGHDPTIAPGTATEGAFDDNEIEGLPEPVQRYFRASIDPGTPILPAASLSIRGSIKLGKRWLPFRSHEDLAPHHGFVWTARVAGVITGSDRYAEGSGTMRWKILGFIPVMTADGPDVSRSDVGRIGGESVWVPTALLPRFGTTWGAAADDTIVASYRLNEVPVDLQIALDADLRVRSVLLDRWGDPDETGAPSLHPFGMEVTGYGTFGGLTIPRTGRAGWFYGTDRWEEGEFFRYEIRSLRLRAGDLVGFDEDLNVPS